LFTLRTVNGETFDRAKQLRIFHGFGDTRMRIGGSIERIDKEAVIQISERASAAVHRAAALPSPLIPPH